MRSLRKPTLGDRVQDSFLVRMPQLTRTTWAVQSSAWHRIISSFIFEMDRPGQTLLLFLFFFLFYLRQLRLAFLVTQVLAVLPSPIVVQKDRVFVPEQLSFPVRPIRSGI